eukprot:scaffold126014_cov35-Tisochrysis_lutea.AAC.1
MGEGTLPPPSPGPCGWGEGTTRPPASPLATWQIEGRGSIADTTTSPPPRYGPLGRACGIPYTLT